MVDVVGEVGEAVVAEVDLEGKVAEEREVE